MCVFGFISKLFLVSKGFFSATHFLRTIMIGGDSAEPSKGLLILLVLAAYSLAPLPAIVPAPILSVVVAGAVIYSASANVAVSVSEGKTTLFEGNFGVCLLPVAAVLVVLGIYGYLSVFGKSSFTEVATGYILVAGAYAIFSTFRPLFRQSWLGDIVTVALVAGLGFSLYLRACGTVLFGIVFSYQGITQLPVSSFRTSFIIFFSMFLVECVEKSGFEVDNFGTVIFQGTMLENMVLFGKSVNLHDRDTLNLGLKDVVLPGLFVSLMLRYDMYNADSKRTIGASKRRPGELPSAPFFWVSFVTLLLGFGMHGVMSHFEDSPMPTFLFSFPACVGCTLSFAMAKQQFSSLLGYSDAEEAARSKDH